MNSPAISIILPSLRENAVNQRIQEFFETNPTADYELLVVSPFNVSGPNVVHIKEQERRGVIHAMNSAYEHVKGRYIVLWSDDAIPCNGCLSQITSFVEAKKTPFLAGFRKKLRSGTEVEQWSVYDRLTVGWLCAKKETIDSVGGLFNPQFKNYWADPDLSMRVWERGGAVEVCPDAWLIIEQANDDVKSQNLNSAFQIDTDSFFNIWHEKYGQGAKKIWWLINVPIPITLIGHIKHVLRKVPYFKNLVDFMRGQNLPSLLKRLKNAIHDQIFK